jgi:uncharacterized membrane protein
MFWLGDRRVHSYAPAVRRTVAASAASRIAGAGAAGVVCGLLVATLTAWHVALLAGWDGAAATFTTLVWTATWGRTAAETRLLATREDPNRALADLILVGASVASLVGTALTLVEAANSAGAGKAALVALATASVAMSWFVVHTVFMLRYARLYYGDDDDGGIDFPGDEAPAYRDFAYVALTIGMTFQVSDTGLTTPAVRSTALRQALLAYLFGVCIVGVTINAVAGILG